MRAFLVAILLLTAWPGLLTSAPASAARQAKAEMLEQTARATAALDVAKHMESRLADQGLRLHPDIIAQRVRVEGAMDEAERLMKAAAGEGDTGGDWEEARKAIRRARAQIDRLFRIF